MSGKGRRQKKKNWYFWVVPTTKWRPPPNSYIESNRSTGNLNRQLLKNIATYITKIYDVLGMISRVRFIRRQNQDTGAADIRLIASFSLANIRQISSGHGIWILLPDNGW